MIRPGGTYQTKFASQGGSAMVQRLPGTMSVLNLCNDIKKFSKAMLAEVKYLNSDEHHSVFPVSQKACDFRLKDLELQARVFSSHLIICHVRMNQVLQQLSRDKVELS